MTKKKTKPKKIKAVKLSDMLAKIASEGSMTKAVAEVWTFWSSSGSGTYETLAYTDNSTSCNCPGWTRRVAVDGSRSCKHTRMVDQGIATANCLSHHNYATDNVPGTVTVTTTNTTTSHGQKGKGKQPVTSNSGGIYQRKLSI